MHPRRSNERKRRDSDTMHEMHAHSSPHISCTTSSGLFINVSFFCHATAIVRYLFTFDIFVATALKAGSHYVITL